MDADKQAKIAKIQAEHAAEAAKAKARTEAAAAKARSKPVIKDNEIEKLKNSMGNAEKKPKGQLGKKARKAKMTEIAKPMESKAAYDFESANKAKGSVSVTADTKVLSSSKPSSAPPIDVDTPVLKNLETKVKTSKPGIKWKTIAQEVAEIKPNIPTRPLEGQGSMVGKPVAKVTVKVPESRLQPPKAAAPAVTAPKPAPAPAKVMTTQGKVVSAANPTPVAAGPAKMTAADLFGAERKPPAAPAPKMTAADLFGSAPKTETFAQKATTMLKGAWKTAKPVLTKIDPTAEYRALGSNRSSWQVTKAAGKGILKTTKNIGKGLGAGLAVDFAGQMGYQFGGAINKGPGQSSDEMFNPLTVGYDVTKAAMSAFDNNNELARLRSQGRKAGLKVTGGDTGFSAVGKGLLGAATLGRVDLGNEIKVEEAPGAKSLRQKRLASGEAKFQANKAGLSTPKADGYSQADYDKLKKMSSRSVVKGSYRG